LTKAKQPRVWRETGTAPLAGHICCATPLCDPHACYRRDCDDDTQSERKKTNHRSLLSGVFEKTQEV
jgi:hypothetical protein